MASPNPPPFSEAFQKASSLRSAPTLVADPKRKSSYFADGNHGHGSPEGKISPNGHSPPALDLDTNGPSVPKQTTGQSSLSAATFDGLNVNEVFARLSPARKNILLAVFSLATALDIVSVSGLLTTTESIAVDLGLDAGNITWIITAYAMTFAS
jgi:hypothetical protein